MENKNEILDIFKSESKELEDLLNPSKEKEIRKLKRNKKILAFLKYRYPYFITAGAVLTVSLILGQIPFYRQNEKKYLNTKKAINSHTGILYEERYDNYNEKPILSLYSKWEPVENGMYERKVTKYNVERKTQQELMELLNKSDLTIKELLGNPLSVSIQQKEKLSPDELNNNESSVEITIYDVNKNEYIIEKESFAMETANTFLLLAIVALSISTLSFFKDNSKKYYEYKTLLNQIEKEYNLSEIEKDLVRRKLELRKNNYNYLRSGDQDEK